MFASAHAQTVTTLSGGPDTHGGNPTGYNTVPTVALEAKYNEPSGLALDRSGNLYIADRNNNAIRRLNITEEMVYTSLTGLNLPVGVAFDRSTNLYVLNQGNGVILSYDVFRNPIGTVASGLVTPTALALDGSDNIYVTELGGTVKRFAPGSAVAVTTYTVPAAGAQLRGIAVLDNGNLAVSDSANHSISIINPDSGVVTLLTGGNGAGFTDGFPANARLNQPRGLAKAPNGSLVVSDYANHRLRVVQTNGITTTLSGIDSSLWASDFPGWEDGSVNFAEHRLPQAATVASDGTVFTVENFYHILRSISGTGLNSGGGGGGGGGGTNVVVVPPGISPSSGYFPMGINVTVTSPNPDVFYTVDGSTPTTNSLRVPMTGNVGLIAWRQSLRDLSSLRVRAFIGTNASDVVFGTSVANSNIGVPRDVVAGIGSTVVVPVVLNLRTNDILRSIQYRVEVTPIGATPNPISAQFRPLSVLSNDFIQVVTAARGGAAATFDSTGYLLGTTRGVAISAISTNANFEARNFAVVGQLAVPIPPTASVGDSYRIEVLFPTGTSDGQQTPVTLAAGPARTIVVSNLNYTVGDTAAAGWYNAGDFGNGDLNNADVNNAFSASLGIRLPFSFSDAFDAMDVFPEDGPGIAGGDGEIRFLDWQVLLFRSLRLDTNNYTRAWSPGGFRTATTTSLSGSPAQGGTEESLPGGLVWYRQATLSAGAVGNVFADQNIDVPITLKVAPGESISGLLFRAEVVPVGDAPAVVSAATFLPGEGIPAPTFQEVPVNQVACGWGLGAFNVPLTGTRQLGVLRFKVPFGAQAGAQYTVRFLKADGSPAPVQTNSKFQFIEYDFETIPGLTVIGGNVPPLPGRVSDEWKTNFFGSLTNVLGDLTADADGDGVPNWAEFASGTSPVDAGSKLELLPLERRDNGAETVLSWLTAPGKIYVVEGASSITGAPWVPVASGIIGDGYVKELTLNAAAGGAQFYRVRVLE